MFIPIIKEIYIPRPTPAEFKRYVNFEQIGLVPTVIKINHMSMEDQKKAMTYLEGRLISKGESIKFPYPTYILTTLPDYNGDLLIISDLIDFPKYFKRKEKMLNVKEQGALNKVRLLQNKLKSIRFDEKKEEMKTNSLNHKSLYLMAKEGHYFEKLLNKMGIS